MIVAVFAALAGITYVMLPVSGKGETMRGRVTDVGPLDSDDYGVSQRATVMAADGRDYVIDVSKYPTCRLGSLVTLHRRPTLLGVGTGISPEGCR